VTVLLQERNDVTPGSRLCDISVGGYDTRQVALMVRVAKFYGSDRQKRELKRLGALEFFRLEKHGDQFIWNVREGAYT
jgi:hypothetical protein